MITVGIVSVDPEQKWIGGRYYLQHLVRAVATLPREEQVSMIDLWWQERPADDPFAEVRSLLTQPRVISLPVSVPGRFFRRMRRTLHGWRDARDLFIDASVDVLFPIAPCSNPGIPLVFWMPDFQPWRMPELFNEELRTWYTTHYGSNGELASRIVVSSDDGLRDLETFFPQFRNKARVLHFCSLPSPDWWDSDPFETSIRYGLPSRFFILSNQFSHHKNHPVVFEAVRRLRDRGIFVTVACTGSTFGFRGTDYLEGIQEFLRLHDLTESIRILDLIPRQDQVALMRRSIALLQPSQFEGWSTVVEDSRTLGKAILLSDIPVHREQAPPRGTFVSVSDPDEWAAEMEKSWNTLSPGPDEEQEAAARLAIRGAALQTGRTFVSILGEAVAG
jgi:glycosyltransferase involved in cell wall biosynthesis